jgi:hypothetical protein
MNPIQYPQLFPRALDLELAGPWAAKPFTRRLVVVNDEAKKAWLIYGGVLRPHTADDAERPTMHQYEKVLLVADVVMPGDIKPFLQDLGKNLCDITGKTVKSELVSQCEKQPVSNHNYWMMSPGAIYTWRANEQPNILPSQLLSLRGPYYPDAEEAARDWLQLGGRGGQADAKGQVVMLLPETRAFIESFNWTEDDEHLQLHLAGTAVGATRVYVKGAYWIGKRISQVMQEVVESSVTLHIPQDADRFDLMLMSDAGEVFEHHRESLSFMTDKRFLGSRLRKTTERILKDLRTGEGQHTEFKPFIFIPKRKKALDREQRSKLDEVLDTVASFANAEGGTIYLGVANDLQVVGLSPGLAEWAEAEANREAAERYAKALKTHIRDAMFLPPTIEVSVVEHGGELLVLVEVPRSETPVSVSKDGRYLRRVGGSNERLPPELWPQEWAARHSNPFLG